MLTTSPILTSDAKNASPRAFQFASSRSPLHGSPRRQRSRGSQNSVSSQSPTVAPSPTTYRATSNRMASPSKPLRTPESAQGNNKPPSGPSPTNVENQFDVPVEGSTQATSESGNLSSQANTTQQIVVPVESSRESANTQAAQEQLRHQPMQSKPSSVKRSAGSPGPTSCRADPHSEATERAGAPDRPAQRTKTLPGTPKTLPLAYETCAVGDLVVLIAHMISELIETNDGLALSSGNLTRFHSRTAPGISVVDYLHRLTLHATLTPPLLLSMVYYIDRLCALYPEFTINTLTVHRFLITAATVAAKGLSDSFWNNATYAKVGGVRVAELKLLELEFLYRVDWKIVPNPDVLVAYYRGLVERCPGYVLEQSGSSSPSEENDIAGTESSPVNSSPLPSSTSPAPAGN